jgi:hypothetical protein
MTIADPATVSPQIQPAPRSAKTVRGNAAPLAAQRPFSLRGFASLLMMLCVLLVLASGIALYVAPRGRVANITSWSLLSLDRQQWVAVHINLSLLFIAVTVIHLWMNWSRLVGYVKKKGRRQFHMKAEMLSAVAVAAAIFAGTVLQLRPIHTPVDWRYELRNSWEDTIQTGRMGGRGNRVSQRYDVPAARQTVDRVLAARAEQQVR